MQNYQIEYARFARLNSALSFAENDRLMAEIEAELREHYLMPHELFQATILTDGGNLEPVDYRIYYPEPDEIPSFEECL